MFKYLFKGNLYQADTLKKLQRLLVAAGYKGNVSKEFQKLADLQASEDQLLGEIHQQQTQQELELLAASQNDEQKNLQEYYDATEPVINYVKKDAKK